MKVLVTAGNTVAPIDEVRCITNIFTGRTGALIALEAHRRGHDVTLATSHPAAAPEPEATERWRLENYRTYDDLSRLMETELTSGGYAAVVHSAAVSDYLFAGAYAPADDVDFDADGGLFTGDAPFLREVGRGKISSSHREIWIRTIPAPKLVDRIRRDWGFRGFLVKFKLEVAVAEDRLQTLAESARAVSDADLLVANTLEGMREWALLLDRRSEPLRIPRDLLASAGVERLEQVG